MMALIDNRYDQDDHDDHDAHDEHAEHGDKTLFCDKMLSSDKI